MGAALICVGIIEVDATTPSTSGCQTSRRPTVQGVKRVVAVSSMAVLFLVSACSNDGETAITSDSVETTAQVTTTTGAAEATTTTEAETTTTTEVAETTTTIDPLGEEAVRAALDTYYSFVWDEENQGVGHVFEARDRILAPPVSDRFAAALARRQADGQFFRGTLTGDILSIEVDGTEATVVACTTDEVGMYDATGAVLIAPDDFSLLTRLVLEFDESAGWRLSNFFLGEQCQR